MRTFKSSFILLWIATNALAGCNVEVDTPPEQNEGNVVALFTPGEILTIKAGLTGYTVKRIQDKNRVRSELYRGSQLLDRFPLKARDTIKWNSNYRLKVTIDDEYTVAGEVTIHDSISFDLIDTVKLSQSLEDINGNPRDFIKKVHVQVNNPTPEDSVYLYLGNLENSGVEDIRHFSFPKRYFALPGNYDDTLNIYHRFERDRVRFTQFSHSFYRQLRYQDITQILESGKTPPANPNTLRGGAGFVSLFYTYTVK